MGFMKSISDVISDFQSNLEPAQNQIGERAESGELTLTDARIGKLLSQTGTPKILETLRANGVESLDIPDHDPSDAVASMEANLHASITELEARGLDAPDSQYDPAQDMTGLSNEDLIQIEQHAGLGQDSVIDAQMAQADVPLTEEQQVDALAREIQQEILAKPDWDEREYGSLIYRTDEGEIKSAPLSRGQTVSEASPGQPPNTRLSVPDDLRDGGEVLAMVHNHPDVGYNNHGDDLNRNPSGGDWSTFDRLDQIGMGNSGDMAHYIIDKTGHMREYHDHDAANHNGDRSPNEPNHTHEVDYDHGAEL